MYSRQKVVSEMDIEWTNEYNSSLWLGGDKVIVKQFIAYIEV